MNKTYQEMNIPATIVDLVGQLISAKNPNLRQSLTIRLEDIITFCQQAIEVSKKNNER